MKRSAVLTLLMTVLLFTLVACTPTASSKTSEVQSSLTPMSSEVLSSCTPVSGKTQSSSIFTSSDIQSSLALGSSKPTSSMTSSEKNMPVRHPDYGQSVEQPKEQTKEEYETEMAERERLGKLSA